MPAYGSLVAELLAAIPEPIIAINPHGCVVYWSKHAEDVFGWTEADTIGRPAPYVPPERATEYHRLLQEVRAGATVKEVRTERRTRNGRTLPMLLSASRDATGCVVFLHRTSLSSPEAIAQAIPKPVSRAANSFALETLGRITAGVIHDVNNLLAVMGGNAELIAEQIPAGEHARECTEVIRAAVRQAANLTQRILGFVRMGEERPDSIELNPIVGGLEPLLRAAVGTDVQLKIRLAPALPLVFAETGALEQILLNLAINARDAMPQGGVLGIRTTRETIRQGRRGWPEHLQTGSYVCITASDTGEGIDEPMRSNLFEPGISSKAGGHGIGLATVREIVTRCRGHVQVDSQPDTGTVFRVYFPALPDETEQRTQRMVEQPSAIPGDVVIIAAANDSIRNATKDALESVGFSVALADDGDEALRIAQVMPGPVACLVAETVLPGICGLKLGHVLRHTQPDLPVVLISGSNHPAERSDGNTVVLQKPFRPQALLGAVLEATRMMVVVQ